MIQWLMKNSKNKGGKFKMEKFDFSGWATKANLRCSDGRIIMPDAFKHNDGKKVPLVWNHQHNDPNEVLGHAILENRDEGVYAYCTFNDTESGKTAKLLVQHGDVNALSIYANGLKQQAIKLGKAVMHGDIREVSLVLAGANPGAYIENVVMMHGADSYECEDEVCIYTGDYISLWHSDDKKEEKKEKDEKEEKGDSDMSEQTKKKSEDNSEETVADVFNTLTEKQKTVVYAMIGQALDDGGNDKEDDKEVKHAANAEDDDDDSDETVADVFNTLSEKQKKVVYLLIGQAIEEAEGNDEESEGGKEGMKHNVFDMDEVMEDNTLSHSEMAAIFEDAKRGGSLKESFLAHGIEDIDVLFPDAANVTNEPGLIKREDSWVTEVLNSVHHTPFARIKTIFADITAEEARAKGYVKGNLKIEEVFKMLKRVTNPTTVYKKQKLDRDDIIDITDLDIVAWLKAEMKVMLNEEIARALLVGDGRTSDSPDKINEENIRPIWTDEDLYTVKAAINVSASTKAEDKAKEFIKTCIKSRKHYKGSGNPVMYMPEDMLTDCLLIEDSTGRVIYDSMEKLATALRVRKIVPVTVMENLTRTVDGNTHTLAGIYVNLNDYNVGANKGGAVSMFDDFDIDYNAQKYLMETRCSGALTKPYSAVAIEFVTGAEG